MPLFHCPMGAAFFEDEDCVRCGLCVARTKQQYIDASKIVREHLKTEAGKRLKKQLIQKVVLCGKGGAGKSTITALLAFALRDLGYRVLVVDTDESNSELYQKLGFAQPPKPLLEILERFAPDGTEAEKEKEWEWLEREEIWMEEIPKKFFVEAQGIRFMLSGKINDPFQGCACTMADIIRDFLLKLELKEKEIVLIDSEAGIESFGRGVERGADTILVIVEPSRDSVLLTKKIKYMAEGIGIRRIRALLNKIPNPELEERMLDEMIADEIRYLGAVYSDPKISEENFTGKKLGAPEASETVRALAKLMLDEAEMSYLREGGMK